MPNNSASSYANSIDPAGGIQQPHTKPELSGDRKPVEVKADFNAALPVTAEQLKDQQVQTTPSEQVAKTNLGRSDGPAIGEAMRRPHVAANHVAGMKADQATVSGQNKAYAAQFQKPRVKGKAVVSAQTLDKLKGINARASLKYYLVERAQEARADQQQSASRKHGRSI